MTNSDSFKQQHDLKVSRAAIGDIRGIFEVQRKTWLDTYVNEEQGITADDIRRKDFASAEKFDRWKRLLQEDNSRVWVAKKDEEVVAFITAEKKAAYNNIGALYVLPDYQRHGLGTMLILSAMEWLGGTKDVFLDVVVYNFRAKSFYAKFGFKEFGETPENELSSLPSGKKMPEIRMVKFGTAIPIS